jgi:hypothetical protein
MFRLIVLSLLVFSAVFVFSLTNSELSILRYQLQMPSLVGNALGFRTVGSFEEGAFGLVWRVSNDAVMLTGQVLAFNSVFLNLFEMGEFEWSRVYFDVFLLFRF